MTTRYRHRLLITGITCTCLLGGFAIGGAQPVADEADIRESLRILRDRFNTKDHLSLVGDVGPVFPTKLMPDAGQDSLQRALPEQHAIPADTGSQVSTQRVQLPVLPPRFRQDITTSLQDDPLDQRKRLAQDVVDLFWEIPPEVDLALTPQSITVNGEQATVVAGYRFTSLPTPQSERFVDRSGTVTVRLKRTPQGWRVTQIGEFIRTIQQTVQGIVGGQ